MQTTWSPIKRIEAGGTSLLSAEKANELIDAINALGRMQINPTANVGTFYMGNPFGILDLGLLDSRLSNVEARLANPAINAICNGSNIDITLTL